MSEDIDRIMGVMATAFAPAFGEAWTRRQVEDALLLGNCTYELIAPGARRPGHGEEAAGFYLSRNILGDEELLLLAVAPAQRRQGLGAKLLEMFVSAAQGRGARRLLLEMRDGNPAATLYRHYGFLPIARRRDYYRAGDGTCLDAVTFARELTD